MSKFIQLTGDENYGLCALDDDGVIWRLQKAHRYLDKQGLPIEEWFSGCEHQYHEYWEKVTEQRGWTGWPPTEGEMASREVEELLK